MAEATETLKSPEGAENFNKDEAVIARAEEIIEPTEKDDLTPFETAKVKEVEDLIGEILTAKKDELSPEDCQRLVGITERAKMIVAERQKDLAQKVEAQKGEMTAEEIIKAGHNYRRYKSTPIPVAAEIGETGGRYIRKTGTRDWWTGSIEDAQKGGYQFKDFMDVEQQWGGDTMLGKMEPTTKQTLFESLGVLEPGQTIEAKAQGELGDKFWAKEYEATLPTKIEGVVLHVWYRAADRNPGIGKESFDADLVIQHPSE